jgi:hypothetical protein
MWALLILASCGNPSVAVTPAPGIVPEEATLWVHRGTAISVEGATAQLAKLPSAWTQVQVSARADTKFSILVDGKRFGPWTTSARVRPPNRGAPELRVGKAVVMNGCPSWEYRQLLAGVAAPLYELSVSAPGAAARTTLVTPELLMVGVSGCEGSTWTWGDESVHVSVRALFTDGCASAPSAPLEVKPPRFLSRDLSLFVDRAQQAAYEYEPLLLLLSLTSTAVVVGLVLGRRRRRPAE